jgi:hypothetical protein
VVDEDDQIVICAKPPSLSYISMFFRPPIAQTVGVNWGFRIYFLTRS